MRLANSGRSGGSSFSVTMYVDPHAAGATAVKLAERDPKTRPYKNLVNAVLRRFLDEIAAMDVADPRIAPHLGRPFSFRGPWTAQAAHPVTRPAHRSRTR